MSENDMRKGRIVISYYIYRSRSLFEFVCIEEIFEYSFCFSLVMEGCMSENDTRKGRIVILYYIIYILLNCFIIYIEIGICLSLFA